MVIMLYKVIPIYHEKKQDLELLSGGLDSGDSIFDCINAIVLSWCDISFETFFRSKFYNYCQFYNAASLEVRSQP